MLVYGFKLNRQQGKQPKVKQAFEDAKKLLEASKKNYTSDHHHNWLGLSITETKVKEYTDQMVRFLDKINVQIDTRSGQSERLNDFAYSIPEKYRGNKNFGDNYEKSWDKKCKGWVCDNFYSSKSSRGERAHSLLHELTHLAIATHDYGLTSGGALIRTDNEPNAKTTKEFYGADYCQELKINYPDAACKNAENWAYYFLAYRNGMNWSDEDQKYLSVSDCKKYRGKRF